MRMKHFKHIVRKFIWFIFNYLVYRFYTKQFKRYMEMLSYKNVKAPGEDAYMEKWQNLSKRIEPYSYRHFYHYMGDNPNIVPEDIGHTIIERCLNPERYRDYYSVKALYATYLNKEYLPETIACRINGGCLLDSNYCEISGKALENIIIKYERLILKPSVDSCSGHGVMLFSRDNNGEMCYIKDNSIKLNADFLKIYGTDFVLQEVVTQHKELAQFCPSSVNTLRLSVYKSVIDEKSHVVASVMRIGKSGEFVDNGHAGGHFVSVDIETGKIGNETFDQFGHRSNVWNGIDFSEKGFYIPHWEEVKKFACEITDHLHLMHFIAFDITVDENGKPKLIEFNVCGFSFWLFQYCGQPVLGNYTDEVIEYCQKRKYSKGQMVIKI